MSDHVKDSHSAAGPGYEVRDANIKALLQFAFWLAMLLAVTLVAMRFTFVELSKLTPLGPSASPFENVRQIPAGPLLQSQPHQELGQYCENQRAQVQNYAWLNQAGGIVQIPVDRAMDLVAQRGLPSRSADEMAAAGATVPPVGAAGEPQATSQNGPCGYLWQPAPEATLPKE